MQINVEKILFSAASATALLLCWQVLSSTEIMNSKLIPPPTKVFFAIVEWAKSGELQRDFLDSIWRAIIGLSGGAIIGITLGLVTGRNEKLNYILSPILNIFKAFPPVAMLPVFITLFGIGNFSKIFSIGFASIFPLWVNTHLGASTIPVEYIRSAKLLTTSRYKYFVRVVVPASMNAIIAGFRISIAISFIMLYVSELAGASSGLGYQISSSHLAYRMDKMLGALLVLGFTATLIDFFFNRLIKYFFPWVQLNKII
jgi:ABC-type nitrate/sulfonate/bicarbonate transport system permease component